MTDKAKDHQDAIGRAVALQAEGRTDEAEAIFRRVLDQTPDHPDALYFLGLSEYQKGRADAAATLIACAVDRDPANPAYLANLGRILAAAGRWREAADALRRAIALDAGAANPHFELGECLYRMDRPADAEPYYRRALALRPDYQGAGNSLGVVLEEQGRTKEAEAVYRRTIDTAGEAPDLLFNLGNVLRDQHRAAESADALRRAIAVKPDFAEAHVHLAYALLMQGKYKAAWSEYEWRWRMQAFRGMGRDYPVPTWNGGPLKGRTLLLWAEQGFGDTLQFARYAGVAARKGGKVILDCQPALVRLMASTDGVSKAVARGDKPTAFDFHAPLLSVAGLLGTTLKSVPGNVPYLTAEPTLVEKWRQRLSGGRGLKIGIAWRGTAERRGNPARACPLAAFGPLIDDPAIRVFSLQKEVPAEDRPLPKGVADLSHEIKDFADTAAIVANLDAVVSIDTAVAHLAGGLGRPTLLMLSTASDWRWSTKGVRTPWYPSVRMFRQPRPGDWAAVVGKVARAVAAMAAGTKARPGAGRRPGKIAGRRPAKCAGGRPGKVAKRGTKRAQKRPTADT